MNQKIGRNEPCPCGSGKKYKNCCLSKGSQPKHKIKASWLNKPVGLNLMERTFGDAIASSGKDFEVQKQEEKKPEEEVVKNKESE